MRVEALQRNCESSISSLRVHLEMEIAKLPKPVLDLTMRVFLEEYQGNVMLYLQRGTTQVDVAANAAARRNGRKRYDRITTAGGGVVGRH